MPDEHLFCCQPFQPKAVYVYDKCSTTRRIHILGSFFSIIVAFGFIALGVYIWVTSGKNPYHVHGLLYFRCRVPPEVPSIVLNLIVTACTEFAGVIHATSLRFALFREHRATYNSNLRLVHGSDERPFNSAISNVIMTILLILSYASSSFFYQGLGQYIWPETEACAVLAMPSMILGISLLLQTFISLCAMHDTNILTWSTSPFNTIPALLSMHDDRSLEKHYPLPACCACMCAVGMTPRSRKPLDHQPSPWDAHRGVRISIYLLWSLVLGCVVWGSWVYAVLPQGSNRSWRFFPSVDNYGEDAINGDYWLTQSGISFATWLSVYAAMIITQGGLTLGLHCAEIITEVVRDENIWRRAASKDGITSSINSWTYAFSLDNWLYVVLLCAKPALHWMFGQAVEIIIYQDSTNFELDGYTAGISFFFAQIFYLGAGLSVVAAIFTVAARRHPKGPQPATYGHIKTLINLVDDWQPEMHWGHKDDGPPCHAGTSKAPLREVDRDKEYGGRCATRDTTMYM